MVCDGCFRSCLLPLLGDQEHPPVGRTRPTVLVVDDDPNIRYLLTCALTGEGFTVENAANGEEALTKVHQQSPQAIVLDLWMPVMSGRRFLEELRQTSPGHSIPVIAISAHGRLQASERLGVEEYLAKPFDLRALIGTVRGLVAASA
jgi:CheY-like chemotaxis protein